MHKPNVEDHDVVGCSSSIYFGRLLIDMVTSCRIAEEDSENGKK